MRSEYIIRAGCSLQTTWSLTAILFCVFVAGPLCAEDDVATTVDELMGRMPVDTATEKEEIITGLLNLGEAGVRELCGRIKDKDEPLDGKVCSALFGLEHAACRKGNEKMRKIVADVFCEFLQPDSTIAAKNFLLTELCKIGDEESVKAVSVLLTVKNLCETASQTLVSIGTDKAAAALRGALPKVTFSQRVTILCSLGRMRDNKAVPLILEEAVHTNADVRHAALFALASIGDPTAGAVLRKAAASDDDGACEKAKHRLLRFAVNLAKRGNKKEAIEVCRELLGKASPTDPGIGSGAFYELVSLLEKEEALKEVQAVIDREKAKVRPPVVKTKRSKPGPVGVFVAYDERVEKLPAWLKDWKDTGTKLETSDVGFTIYTRPFPQAAITLGGNACGSESQSHYIIILTGLVGAALEDVPTARRVVKLIKNKDLRKQAEELVSGPGKPGGSADADSGLYIAEVSTGAGCKLVPNGLKIGARVYIDRDYTIEKIPENLQGESYVATSNEDKGCDAERYITLMKGKRPAKVDRQEPALRHLFNGRDFEGWVVPENNIWWNVQDGMISCKSGPKKSGNALWTEKKYRDFILRLDFRYGEGIVDTGIYLRTTRHQVQLGISGSLKRDMTGSMYIAGRGYPQEAEGVKELLKPKDWNTMKVQAIGSVYTIWLNGREVSVFKAKKVVDEGPIGLQLHGGKVMAADFRNIDLAELK